MNLKLEIRRNSDGAMASDIWRDWVWNAFWWKDGNASCDCNRELFFLRARKENDEADADCSDGRYSVRLSDADSGQTLYDEFGSSDSLSVPVEGEE